MKELSENLKKAKDPHELLKVKYPCVFIFLLKKMDRLEDLEEYMQSCRKFEEGEDVWDYSRYLHGYWLP